MSHTYEKISSNKAKLTFVIPAEQFDEAMNKAFLKNRSKINIPGFRKGKAPRKMIENMYGEAIFYDDAFEAIFPDAYEAAVKSSTSSPWIALTWTCRKSPAARTSSSRPRCSCAPTWSWASTRP